MDSFSYHNYVQIQADADEVKRRIAAFCARKRSDIDAQNIKLYCGNRPNIETVDDNYTSCARVDAVSIPRYGKSRYKVSSVYNKDGPQISSAPQQDKQSRHYGGESLAQQAAGPDLDGRVALLEHHCRIDSRSQDLLQRIKALEDRVIFLEGLSLEYFNPKSDSRVPLPDSEVLSTKKDIKTELNSGAGNTSAVGTFEVPNEALSIQEIDEKINRLKERLKLKAFDVQVT